MKAVILAGGFGTRFSETTNLIPKPLIEIGSYPILWHIMKLYSFHGIKEFIICLGYKGNKIKRYFSEYSVISSDFKINLKSGCIQTINSPSEDWNINLIDTGLNTMTGGRIKAIEDFLDDNEPFCLTYGDGVGDIDISSLVSFHKKHSKLATVTSVTPPGRFGVLDIENDTVLGFREKIASDQYKINAGFFVLSKDVLKLIDGPKTVWENEPMVKLAKLGELKCWQHDGFWMPMDTKRDHDTLEKLWADDDAPWKIWND